MAFEILKNRLRHDNKKSEVMVNITPDAVVTFSKGATDLLNPDKKAYISIYVDTETSAIAVMFHDEKADYCRKVTWDKDQRYMRVKIASAFNAIKTRLEVSTKFKPIVEGEMIVIWRAH